MAHHAFARNAVAAFGMIFIAALPVFAQAEPDLPPRGDVLWSADHEGGNLDQWTDAGFRSPGGGVLNTGSPEVAAVATRDVSHAGRWSAKTVITGAVRAQNGDRAVRLMRWTDKAWDDGGRHFPDEAYYSTWLYFGHDYDAKKREPWDPGDGGWWNVFQFKSEDRRGVSQPLWVVNVGYDEARKQMFFYLFAPRNRPVSFSQASPLPVPARKWVHLEAFYRSATDRRGRICIWQDGRKIFDVAGVTTSLGGRNGADTHTIWGVGNYTDHVASDPAGEGTATVYFDDAAVRAASGRRAQISPNRIR